MPEPPDLEAEPGLTVSATRAAELALLVLRSRGGDPCAERVALALERRRSPAERVALAEGQTAIVVGVINAVLDGLGLTAEQRQRGLELAARELDRAG